MPQTMREWEREAHTEFENERLNKPAPKCGVSRFVIAIEIAMFLPHSFLPRRHHEGNSASNRAMRSFSPHTFSGSMFVLW